MINLIHKLYAVRDPTPSIEPREKFTAPKLPADHPCSGCRILAWDTGVPYCFLPRCNREIFKLVEANADSNFSLGDGRDGRHLYRHDVRQTHYKCVGAKNMAG